MLLTIPDRDFRVDVTELPNDCPVLIGQVPQELHDFVDQTLADRTSNPEHGGQQMIELY